MLAAVSGGSDSVALIHLLKDLQEKLRIKKLAIAHINHGLRENESDGDEQLVRRIAADLDLPFFLKRLSGHKLTDSGIEQWARQERYKFLHSILESSSFDFIATGHTADDQAETLLFRMLRGAGIKGMRGILPVREDGVIRPLLFITKSELLQWLNSKCIPFRNDSSNADISLSRNFIRHELLPVITRYQSDAVKRMTTLSLQMQDAWTIIEKQIHDWVEEFVVEDSDESFAVNTKGFLHREIASEGLKFLFEKHGIPADRFHVGRLFVNSKCSRTFLLPAKWQYNPAGGIVYFSKGKNTTEELFCKIPIPGVVQCHTRNIDFTVTEVSGSDATGCEDRWSVFMDRDAISGDSLIYRRVDTEDVFCPKGRATSTSVLRFLAKQGFPKVVRSRAGVVVDGSNKVLWIPGIRLNQQCAVSKSSRHIIKIASKAIGNNI